MDKGILIDTVYKSSGTGLRASMNLASVDRLFRRLCEIDPNLKNGRTLDHGALSTTSLSLGGSMVTVSTSLRVTYSCRSGPDWTIWDGPTPGSAEELISQWPDGYRAQIALERLDE
jgi:hypothetical protein